MLIYKNIWKFGFFFITPAYGTFRHRGAIEWNKNTIYCFSFLTWPMAKLTIKAKLIDLEEKIREYLPGKVYYRMHVQCGGESWESVHEFKNYKEFKKFQHQEDTVEEGWSTFSKISKKEYDRQRAENLKVYEDIKF